RFLFSSRRFSLFSDRTARTNSRTFPEDSSTPGHFSAHTFGMASSLTAKGSGGYSNEVSTKTKRVSVLRTQRARLRSADARANVCHGGDPWDGVRRSNGAAV